MSDVDQRIRMKFSIKRGSYPPYLGEKATREGLAEVFGDLSYTKGAEIGVKRGKFSEFLCSVIPDLKLLCVDPWVPYSEISDAVRIENYYLMTLDRLAKYSGVTVRRAKSVEASREVPDGSLDFVYIDAGHTFPDVMMDIIHWAPKVRSGGIVAGHDYVYARNYGVIQAVDAYRHTYGITQWYLTGDVPPTWFWVQP